MCLATTPCAPLWFLVKTEAHKRRIYGGEGEVEKYGYEGERGKRKGSIFKNMIWYTQSLISHLLHGHTGRSSG